jgi:DNA helicase II / ATP-dependent DNA helicase PcrA
VLSVGGRSDDPEAEVDFGGDYGVKRLVLRYAPVSKL